MRVQCSAGLVNNHPIPKSHWLRFPTLKIAPGAELLGAPDVTRDNIVRLYEAFLRRFHFKNPAAKHCRLTEHFAKFESPPKNQKRSFETFDLWMLIWEVNGVDGVCIFDLHSRTCDL